MASSELQRDTGTARQRAMQLVGLVLLVALLAWAAHGLDRQELLRVFREAHPAPLVLATLLNVAALALQSWRWQLLIRPIGKVAYRHAFGALVVGFALSTVLPARAGEIARVHLLARRTGLGRAALAGTLVLDHVFNGVTVAPLALVVPFSSGVPAWVREGVGLVLLVTFGVAVAAWAAATGDRVQPTVRGWRARLREVRRGLFALRSPRLVAAAGTVAVSAWVAEALVCWLSLRAFGIDGGPALAVVALIAVNLALALPAPPANLGTFEVGAVLVLTALGVPREQAMGFALGYHALQLVSVWAVGWPAWVWARREERVREADAL